MHQWTWFSPLLNNQTQSTMPKGYEGLRTTMPSWLLSLRICHILRNKSKTVVGYMWIYTFYYYYETIISSKFSCIHNVETLVTRPFLLLNSYRLDFFLYLCCRGKQTEKKNSLKCLTFDIFTFIKHLTSFLSPCFFIIESLKKPFYYYSIMFLCVFCLHLCPHHVPAGCPCRPGGQKRRSDPLELEL